MFKFVLGHSKAWLFYNRFLLCLKSVHIEKTAQLRFRFVSLFGVRQTRLSPPASRQINLTPCIRAPSCFSLLSQNLSRLFHCSVINVLCIVVFATAFIFYQKLLHRTQSHAASIESGAESVMELDQDAFAF